jgi:DeoR family transcriptional regulator of aga operon
MVGLRQEKIRNYIGKNEIVTLKQLHDLCPEVTAMTLHRDLDTLQKAGYIVKMRGGARAVSHSSDPSYFNREHSNVKSKELIAAKALEFIQPGSSIFLDAGTTCLSLIRILPDIHTVIFTSGANFAIDLQRLSNASINYCCGNLNRSNLALSGPSTLNYLENINIDLGFIGISGFSEESGFTCGKESEMLVKKLVIQKARTTIALMDSSKLKKMMPYTFAHFEDFDFVLTDEGVPESFIQQARQAGTQVR